MKRIVIALLALVMVCSCVACANTTTTDEAKNPSASVEESTEASTSTSGTEEVTVMTYAEFVAAAVESKVCVETYVQAKQGWWEKEGQGVATFYTQNEDGAYFIYEMPCTKAEYDQLTAGTKIRVNGYKAEWEGEVEIIDATFEIIEDAEHYIVEAFDATALLGTDELIAHQNELVAFNDMTVKEISYKNDGGDDIYVTLTSNGADYSFCVEVYLTGTDSEVYTTVGTLKAGDVVNVQCFLYWYQGANPHITAIALAE